MLNVRSSQNNFYTKNISLQIPPGKISDSFAAKLSVEMHFMGKIKGNMCNDE